MDIWITFKDGSSKTYTEADDITVTTSVISFFHMQGNTQQMEAFRLNQLLSCHCGAHPIDNPGGTNG